MDVFGLYKLVGYKGAPINPVNISYESIMKIKTKTVDDSGNPAKNCTKVFRWIREEKPPIAN